MRCSNVIDGAIDGDAFAAFVKTTPVPTLKPNVIMVLDNPSSPKRADTREMIHQAGASLWFLRPYSPDLNPIENAFSKLRRLYESAGHRTIDAMWRNTQAPLETITPSNASGFFMNCGHQDATKIRKTI